MDDIAHVSLESVRSVYPSLTRLQCIVELENFGNMMNRFVSFRAGYLWVSLKHKPKWSRQQIRIKVDIIINQWEPKVKTGRLLEARKNVSNEVVIGFSFASYCLTHFKIQFPQSMSFLSQKSNQATVAWMWDKPDTTSFKQKLKFSLVDFSTEDNMVDIWNERFPLPDNDFEFLEPLLALRTTMLHTVVKLRYGKRNDAGGLMRLGRSYKDLATHLEMQARLARRSHNPQVLYNT